MIKLINSDKQIFINKFKYILHNYIYIKIIYFHTKFISINIYI